MAAATSAALATALLLLAAAASLVSGTPCPPEWRQSGSWCYLTNTSSTLSWAGAAALCQEHGGDLVSINNRSKLLDVIDILRIMGMDKGWWIGIQKTSGSTALNNRTNVFDNYGEEKIEKDASETHLCVYMSAADGLWYWSECDSALPYICQKEAGRVDIVVVSPERRRPAPAWFREHGANLETELRAAAVASAQDDDKGEYDANRATMTPIPPSTTTPAPAETPASGPGGTPSPASTTPSPCSDGWMSLADVCHQLFLDPKNWSMAEQFCQDKGGHLTGFDNAASQAAFRGKLSFNSGSVWIGLSRRDSPARAMPHPFAFRWTNNLPPQFFSWTPGHPLTAPGLDYSCVALSLSTGYWMTVECSAAKPFSCSRAVDATERPPSATTTPPTVVPSACGDGGWWQFGSTCLLLVADTPPVSWYKAELACRNRSASLVKITSFALNNNILTKLRGSRDPVWIGLNRLGPQKVYHWTDGSNVSYTYWTAGGNNSRDMASCVWLDNSSGYWSTVNCNAPLPYVCQRAVGGGALSPPPPPPPPPPRSSCPSGWQPYGPDRCLRVNTEQKTWAAARQWCRDQRPDADLLSVPSAIYQAFLTSAVKTSINNLWISLTYAKLINRRFLTWTDESAVNYTSWAPGQPSTPCDDCPDTCGVVDGRSTSTPAAWSNVACSEAYGFVCQLAATPNNSIDITPTACSMASPQYIAAGDACYRIVNHPLTWHDAADACQRDGSGLAYVADVFDNSELVKLLYRAATSIATNCCNEYWLGLSDTARHGMMEWTRPWPPTAVYHNWDNGTRQSGRESCAVIVPSSGRWQHRSCSTDRRPFVCLRAPEREAAVTSVGHCPSGKGWYAGDGRCYRAFEPGSDAAGLNWTEAKAACEKLGSQLATVSTVADFRAVRQAVRSLTTRFMAWIGLRSQSDSEYMWSDGTPMSYRSWYRNEPRFSPGCGLTSRVHNGHWLTADCTVRAAYVCMTAMHEPTGPEASTGSRGGWSVFGVVILVLALTVALAGVGLWFARRRRAAWLPAWLLGSRNVHHSAENLAYNRHHNALSSNRAEGDTLENSNLDAIAANRWGSQEQLVIHENL